MTLAGLPDLIHRGLASGIFVLGIGMVAVHTTLAALAAQRSRNGRAPSAIAAVIGAYLAIWFGLAIMFADRANFPLEREDLRLGLSLLIGFGPMLVAIAAVFTSRALRRLNAGTPPQWLIWAQTYRMAGVMFLFPLLAYGILPAGFAIPAGLGDFATGVFAPVVGRAIAEGRPHAVRWAVAWNLFGILDLLVAPAAAILSHAQLIALYPVSLVALFIGPPLGILTHVYSLRNLAAVSSSAVSDVPDAAHAAERRRTTVQRELRTT